MVFYQLDWMNSHSKLVIHESMLTPQITGALNWPRAFALLCVVDRQKPVIDFTEDFTNLVFNGVR